MLLSIECVFIKIVRPFKVKKITGNTYNWMNTMMTEAYLMWKPISLVNLIYKVLYIYRYSHTAKYNGTEKNNNIIIT